VPLPSDLVVVSVSGSFPLIDGEPQDGYVTFDPGTPLRDTTGAVILAGAATAQVRGSVMIPISLPATDNATLSPSGWAYSVTVHLGGSTQSYTFALASSLSPTVDLSQLVNIAPPPPPTAFTAGNTWTGTQVFAGSPPMQVPGGAGVGEVLTSDASGNATWQAPTGGGGGGGISPPVGDLGGTAFNPTVRSTHLTSALPVAQGGTGAITAGAALTSLGAASASGLTAETTRA